MRGYQALFLFLLVPPVAADEALSDTGYSVLVLHSYHKGYAWTDSVSAGISSVDIRVYWSAIVGIVVLGIAVVMLGISLRRQKRAEKALRDSREMLAELAGEQHTALLQIEKNLEQMAILNDHIRNPLTVIVALVDMQGWKIRDKVLEQAAEIDSIINKLDRGWLESDKIREFLKKHHPGNE